MKTTNQNILLVSAGVVLIIVGSIWYLTQQSIPYPSGTSLATTTTMQVASSTTKAPAASTSKSGTVTTRTTTTVTTTNAPASTGTPHITEFVPAGGSIGTQVTIIGTNFDSKTNYITFGTSAGRHRADGTADNVIATVGSTDGKTLMFTVPSSGPSGRLCDAQNSCVAISSVALSPGTYPVTVRSKNGTSNTALFTIIR